MALFGATQPVRRVRAVFLECNKDWPDSVPFRPSPALEVSRAIQKTGGQRGG